MFQILFSNQEIQGENMCYVPDFFFQCNDYEHLNTQYFYILLRFQKSTEPNKCIQIHLFMKMFIKMIPMIF